MGSRGPDAGRPRLRGGRTPGAEVARSRSRLRSARSPELSRPDNASVCPTWLGKGSVRGEGGRSARTEHLRNKEPEPENFIGGFESVGSCEAVVDSGAQESVWAENWLPEVRAETTGAGRKRFVVANGQEMGHYGRNVVKFRREGGPEVLSLAFEVTDVTMPLVAGQ